jgi:hypothetical protein
MTHAFSDATIVPSVIGQPDGTEGTINCLAERSPGTMDVAERIRNHGFKRWYERQLIESHLYFVTCFLSGLLVAACLEQFGFQGPETQRAAMLALAVGGGALCAFSWKRFKESLMLAERLAESATCGKCGVYASFRVLAHGPRTVRPDGEELDAPDEDATWLRVRCRKCQHEWTIR